MSNFVFFGTGGLLSSICLRHIVNKGKKPQRVFIQKSSSAIYPNLTELVCIDMQINYTIVNSVNSRESIDQILSNKPDFGIIASFGEIIKKPLLGSFPIYNVHMGVLPDYRGAYTNFWKIMAGHDLYGVTIHEIDEKIDSGQCLLIREKDFSEEVLSGEFFRKNYQMAADALVEVLKSIQSNTIKGVPIQTNKGKYYPKHTIEDMQLNPTEDVKLLYKKINRLQFYGHPRLGEYQIFACDLLYDGQLEVNESEISHISYSAFILKNKTGILLLKHLDKSSQ